MTEWTVRLAADQLAPHMNRAMSSFDAASRRTSLESPLLELVRLRASQINGCAYCVDTHSRDARESGETERRLYAVAVWRETTVFSERERAALALTEAMTRLSDGPVSDDVFDSAAKRFTDVELAELVWSITVINAWNRVAVTTRAWAPQ
jgi:AhpD family alkylhydroperoxidase